MKRCNYTWEPRENFDANGDLLIVIFASQRAPEKDESTKSAVKRIKKEEKIDLEDFRYHVEEILSHRTRKDKKEYLMSWEGANLLTR